MKTIILSDLYTGDDYKYHYFYKIVNKINGKFYYGIHTTKNIFDNYIGSGKLLNLAYSKYGIHNFVKYIVTCFDNRNDLSLYENTLIDKLFLIKYKNVCYNVKTGGDGWLNLGYGTYIDQNGNTIFCNTQDPSVLNEEIHGITYGKGLVKDKITGKLFYKSIHDIDYNEYEHVNTGIATLKDKNGNICKINIDSPEYISGNYISIWQGKHHNKQTKDKISKIIQNKRNELFGLNHPNYQKHWINNGEINLLVFDIDTYLKNGWLLGRINVNRTMSDKALKAYINRCYINKDNINKLVKIDKAEYLVNNEGWSYGRIREKTKWIHNNSKSLMVKESLLNEYLSNGWLIGRK